MSFKSDHVKFGGMFWTKTRLEGGEDWGLGLSLGCGLCFIELLIWSLFGVCVWVDDDGDVDGDGDGDVDIDQSSM